MSKSMRLRISEVKAAFNLIGECRELWNTPPAWRVHLLRGLTELTGLAVGHYAEVDASSFAGPIQFLAAVDFGWRDEAARNYYLRYTADLTGACTAPMPGIDILARRLGEAGRAIAYRPELCSDSQWYRSAAVNEYRRPAFNDGYVLSFVRGQNNLCTHLGVHQDTSVLRLFTLNGSCRWSISRSPRWWDRFLQWIISTTGKDCRHVSSKCSINS